MGSASSGWRTAVPLSELPWLRRRWAIRSARRMLRLAQVEGLLPLDRNGNAIWAPGHPRPQDPS